MPRMARQSARTRAQAQRVRDAVQQPRATGDFRTMRGLNIKTCMSCRRWFSSTDFISGDDCSRCRRSNNLYTAENGMRFGEIPAALKGLTMLEELLIARVHPVVSVYRIRGQQRAYSGHVMNFSQHIERMVTRLPHDPRSLRSILIIHRHTVSGLVQFRVRSVKVRQALIWLKQNNQYYRDIIIDENAMSLLPDDADLASVLPSILDRDSEDGEVVNENRENFFERSCFPTIPQANVQQALQRHIDRNIDQNEEIDIGSWPEVSPDHLNEFTTEGLVCRAFPVLFPYGHGDLRAPRLHSISNLQYFQYLMMYHDGRFADDTRFPYYAYNSIARWMALNCGNYFVRRNQFQGFNSSDIQEIVENPGHDLASDIMYYASTLRGTRPYWKQRCSELIQMVRQLGTPTIFFTLSAADYHWPDLFRILCPQGTVLSSLSENQRHTLMHDHPAVVAWFFAQRVDAFMNKFLIPIFGVREFWYRYEWQHRGSPHVHGLLWLDGSPNCDDISSLNEEARREIVRYFDQFVSACINECHTISNRDNPCRQRFTDLSETQVPVDLDRVLSVVQRHSRCGDHCLRRKRNSRRHICRYGFPHPHEQESRVELENGVWKFVPKRNCSLLQRYNPLVTQVWRGNTDFSPITSKDAVLNYISKYASKGEYASIAYSDILRNIIGRNQDDTSAATLVRQLIMTSLAERNYSAQEVMHLLMSWPLYKASRQIIVLSIKDDWHRLGGESGITFLKRYAERPNSLEHMSLHNFAKKFYFRGQQMVERRKEAVVRVVPYLKYSEDHDPNSEYYMFQCRLHIPWRDSSETLRAEGMTWRDVFLEVAEQADSSDQFATVFPHDPDDIAYIDEPYDHGQIRRDPGMAASRIVPEVMEADRLGERPIDEAHVWPDLEFVGLSVEMINEFLRQSNLICDRDAQLSQSLSYESMSLGQRQIIDELIRQISSLRDMMMTSSVKRVLVQGKAGTGKSAVIHSMCYKINQSFASTARHPTYQVLAPTGIAAINIDGKTIHSFLRIPINGPIEPLNGESLRSFQIRMHEIKFIIIHEYSMIGMRLLHKIHHRLCEARGSFDEPFGGYNIYLFGDLRQLPPVRDIPIYLEPRDDFSRRSLSLINSFETKIILSTCHRQSEDQLRFIQTLDRIAMGVVEQRDWELLMTRRSGLTLTNHAQFDKAVYLFHKNTSVIEHNNRVVSRNGRPVLAIEADHNNSTARQAASSLAGGLQRTLYLSTNSRIMLRKNLNVAKGLVNGSLGFVREIIFAKGQVPPSMPSVILIEFDNYSKPYFRGNLYPLLPTTASWRENSVDCVRRQFPINLAYALTIHKAQGLTLDKVVVDIGEKEMSVGLTYVALSRVRKLSDIIIAKSFNLARLTSINTMQHGLMRERFLSRIE